MSSQTCSGLHSYSLCFTEKKSFTKHSRMQYLVISQTEPTEITYSIEILRTIDQYCHMVGMKGEGRVSGAWENTERGQGNVRWRMIDYEKYFVESSNTHQGNGKRTFLDLVRHLLETPRKTEILLFRGLEVLILKVGSSISTVI